MNGIFTRRNFVGAICAAGLLPLSAMSASAQGVSIDIGTMDVGSTWYQYGVTLSQYMKGALPDGSVINVRPYAAADANLRLIDSDQRIQIGMTFANNIAWATRGMTDISDATADNVRLLAAGIDQYYVGMAARSDLAADTITDALEGGGLQISTLPPGSLGEIATLLLLRAHGQDEAALDASGGGINRVGIKAAADAMVTGRSDVWVNPISIGHPLMTEIMISNDTKLLGIGDEALAQMTDFGFSAAILPAGSFDGQDADLNLPGTATTLVVNADMDEEIVYLITKAMLDNLDAIKSENAALSLMTATRMADSKLASGLPLHPGAERAYREAGVLD